MKNEKVIDFFCYNFLYFL